MLRVTFARNSGRGDPTADANRAKVSGASVLRFSFSTADTVTVDTLSSACWRGESSPAQVPRLAIPISATSERTSSGESS